MFKNDVVLQIPGEITLEIFPGQKRAFSFSSFPAIVPFYITAENSLRLQANQIFGNNGGQHSVS